MSTVAGQRHVKETPQYESLDAYDLAEILATHTIMCCANPSIFLPEHKDVLTDKIVAAAIEIVTCIGEANDIRNDRTDEEFQERLKLERRAIYKLKSLPRMLSLAKKLNPEKFRKKKLTYWIGLVEMVRKKTVNWNRSDELAYSEFVKKRNAKG